MRREMLFLICLAMSDMSYGRETGYALECSPIGEGFPRIISFLEEGVDKIARLLETETGSSWDSHEWQNDKLIIKSFTQPKGGAATMISYVELNKETLIAEFFKAESPEDSNRMQCRKWGPKTTNKGINLSF